MSGVDRASLFAGARVRVTLVGTIRRVAPDPLVEGRHDAELVVDLDTGDAVTVFYASEVEAVEVLPNPRPDDGRGMIGPLLLAAAIALFLVAGALGLGAKVADLYRIECTPAEVEAGCGWGR